MGSISPAEYHGISEDIEELLKRARAAIAGLYGTYDFGKQDQLMRAEDEQWAVLTRRLAEMIDYNQNLPVPVDSMGNEGTAA